LTMNGAGLYRFMPFEDFETAHPHSPRTPLERVSARVAWFTGAPRFNLLFAAFCLALLVAPLAGGPERRAILFALISMALAWAQMFFNAGTGSSVHHTILLWPLPQMVIGISLAAASRRLGPRAVPAAAAVLAVMMAWGLAVTNGYYSRLVRNGPAGEWSDAVFQLSTYFSKTPASEIFAVDWGIMDSLRLLNRGRLRLGRVDVLADDSVLTSAEQNRWTKLISRPDNLFVTHTTEFVFFSAVDRKLERFARDNGFRRQTIATISDSYQRPTFEIYRFVPAPLP
jgi:hypothetical protein